MTVNRAANVRNTPRANEIVRNTARKNPKAAVGPIRVSKVAGSDS
jgi:hypothetical protein